MWKWKSFDRRWRLNSVQSQFRKGSFLFFDRMQIWYIYYKFSLNINQLQIHTHRADVCQESNKPGHRKVKQLPPVIKWIMSNSHLGGNITNMGKGFCTFNFRYSSSHASSGNEFLKSCWERLKERTGSRMEWRF